MQNNKNLSVIILASSYINRMKSAGPTALYKDSFGKSILEHQIKLVRSAYPDADIVVISGLWSDKISLMKNADFRIVENQLFDSTNEVADTRLALNNIHTNRVLIINGDLYFNRSTLNDLPEESFIIYDSTNQLHNVDIGITIVDQNATILTFDLHSKYAGIIHIDEYDFEMFHKLCIDRTKSRLFLFEIINNMVNNGAKIKCVMPKGMKILKVTSPDILKQYKEVGFS